jgi:thiamine biosynthesis lipoprotein ApbE
VDEGLFVVGPKALKLLEKMPGMQGAIFTPDGRILTTPGLKASFPARWDTPAKPR